MMTARWLDLPADAMNVAAAFRLSLDLPGGDVPSVLHIAAADFYRLWVDGRLVAHGPARTAHGYTRVDDIPLSGNARRATLFIEVHSVHVPCFDGVEQDAFLAAELVAPDGRILASTDDFEAWHDGTLVQRIRRYSYQRGFVESCRIAADAGGFRRGGAAPAGWVRSAMVPRALPRLLPRGVPRPALAFHDAGTPIAAGAVSLDCEARPVNRREVTLVGKNGFKGFLPSEWEDDPSLDAAQLVWHAEDSNSRGGGRSPTGRLYDFGRTLTGFFSLHVRATSPEGATILVVYDELRAPENASFPVDAERAGWSRIVKWRLAAGDHDLLSFHPASARFAAVITLGGSTDIKRFGIVDYENPEKSRIALPPTGDAELDEIIAAARETFAQNAVDVLTDCPSRERAGWLFDAMFTSRAEALFTGRNAVERAFLENYALAPQLPTLPAGMVPMCYPADHPTGEFIPTWGLWWVLQLAQYRDRTGDEAIIDASRAKIGELLDYFRRFENQDGLLENLEGWVFIEWSACNDADHVRGVNYPANFLYAAGLDAAARLLGDPALAKRAAAVRTTAARQAWNGEWFEDNAVRDDAGTLRLAGHVTETGQYYAFYFGVASPETHPALWDRLCSDFGPAHDTAGTYPDVTPSNAIPGAYMRLELLLRTGRAEQCLDECRLYFTPMARLTGTLWEHLSTGASLNHGFASSAAWLIHRALRENQ